MQLVADGHQQAGGRAAVVGAHKVDVAQRVVGLVVRASTMTPFFLPGKRTMKLRIGTGPMGVSAVKVSSSSWSCRAGNGCAETPRLSRVPGRWASAGRWPRTRARTRRPWRRRSAAALSGQSGSGAISQRRRQRHLPDREAGRDHSRRPPWLLWPCAARGAPTRPRRCPGRRAPAWEPRRCTSSRDRGWGR